MKEAVKILIIFCLLWFDSEFVFAHAGSHGNDECIVMVGHVELRLNGYQFKGRNPDRHYCRHFPHLGQTIIKIDSVSDDLSNMAIELLLLKRNTWLGLVLGSENAFSVIKKLPKQYFSKQVVSIDANIQSRDLYAIKLRLYTEDNKMTDQQFMFFVGLPFVQVMVAIAVLLLLLIVAIFVRQLWVKKKQKEELKAN